MWQFKRISILLVKNLRFLSSVSMRLVKLTGKSKHTVHPKHLMNEKPWFLSYLRRSDRVLDLGCGNGLLSLQAAKVARAVVAVDKKVPDVRAKKVTYIQGDLEKRLNFPNKSFEVVLCLDVLEHLHRRDQLLGEMKRVLTDGGKLFISLPNSRTSWKRLQRSLSINSFTDSDHKVEYSSLQVKNLLSGAGFRILETTPVTYDTPLAPLIDLVGGVSLTIYKKLAQWRREKMRDFPQETTGFRLVCQSFLSNTPN